MSEQWIAVIVIIVSTLLNAAYFLPIVYAAFFRQAADEESGHYAEAPLPIVIALCLTALATLALFIMPNIPLELSQLLV